ncbi:DUF1284 domain-containing protein [Methanothermobacter marburgensis]|uniref:DUF1284 domain-containing protein n=1 Tax=Methanothermobacter marburgensis TaxID=145263 RepID=UPI0035BA1E63
MKRLTSINSLNGDCPELIIRAHHLLCMRGFQGYGYSMEFVDNMERILKWIHDNPRKSMTIVDFPDDICAACPFLDGSTCLRAGDTVTFMDRMLMDLLGIKSGDELTSTEIDDLISPLLDSPELTGICGECSWIDVCLVHRKP